MGSYHKNPMKAFIETDVIKIQKSSSDIPSEVQKLSREALKKYCTMWNIRKKLLDTETMDVEIAKS